MTLAELAESAAPDDRAGSVIIIVEPTDCLFKFGGVLTPMP